MAEDEGPITEPAEALSPTTGDAPPDQEVDAVVASLIRQARERLGRVGEEVEAARALVTAARLLGGRAEVADLEAALTRFDAGFRLLAEPAVERLPDPGPAASIPDGNAAAEPAPLPVAAPLEPGDGPPPAAETPRVDQSPAAPPSPAVASTPPPQPAPAPPPPVFLPRGAGAPAPGWEPRPLAELEQERAALSRGFDALAGLRVLSGAELVHFKGLCCRLRAAREERTRHYGAQDEWRALDGRARGMQREQCPDEYCIPLRLDLHLVPDRWLELAGRYEDLELAVEALDWLEKERPKQPEFWVERDARALLESAAAASDLLRRWLAAYLPLQREDQREDLTRRLQEIARRERAPLQGLQAVPPVPDDELQAAARDLEERFRLLQDSVLRRARQHDALARLRAWIEQDGFGAGEDDDDDLCAAVRHCLHTGILPNERRLRDLVVDWLWMLEDVPDLAPVHDAALEEQVRRQAEQDTTAAEDEDRPLPDDLREKRDAILPFTRDRTALIIGGICREDNRRRIQETLQFSEVRWPETDSSDSLDWMETQIPRADVVFLLRFNRKRCKRAIPLCGAHDRMLVRLPHGYGLHEVVEQLWAQTRRRAAVSTPPEGPGRTMKRSTPPAGRKRDRRMGGR